MPGGTFFVPSMLCDPRRGRHGSQMLVNYPLSTVAAIRSACSIPRQGTIADAV